MTTRRLVTFLMLTLAIPLAASAQEPFPTRPITQI